RPAGSILEILLDQFLPGSNRSRDWDGCATRPARDHSGWSGDGGARCVLDYDACGGLALLRLFLPSVLLPRLGAQLCRGVPGTLRLPAGELLCELRELIQPAVQPALVQQRLPSGTPLGPQDALDQDAAVA